MAERHPLRDLPFSAIAKCDDSDDAAYLCADGRVAVVHLTFTRERIDNWPHAAFFDNVEDWLAQLAEPDPANMVVDCPLCGADWGAGEVGPECECCGGFALERPCPICAGQRGAVWKRAVQDSWDQGQAIWVGACKSPK